MKACFKNCNAGRLIVYNPKLWINIFVKLLPIFAILGIVFCSSPQCINNEL